MKAVLQSIHPKYCELIASRKKTIEIRKTRPKIETPFKVYIYCTKSNKEFLQSRNNVLFYCENRDFIGGHGPGLYQRLNGKVIGEYVCDSVKMSFVGYNADGLPSYWDIVDGSCLTPNELVCYGEWKTLYGWHIDRLVIYDKPRELSEFITFCPEWEKECFDTKCLGCKYYFSNCVDMRHECTVEGEKPLTRPPQSWCYVEDGDS